jgi:hypothetical protein
MRSIDKLADREFVSSFPTRHEAMRLSPYEGSKRIVAAFDEAMKELKRRGNARPNREEAAKLLGSSVSTSTYQLARNHVIAIETYGISPDLPKQEAVRRMKLLNPVVERLARDLDEAHEKRSDVEILADAVSALIIRASKELTRLDAGALAAYLRRDPQKQGSTRSALIDLQRWYVMLERALDSPLRR